VKPLTHQRQRREMFVDIAVCPGFKGAAHQNIHFQNITVRCTL